MSGDLTDARRLNRMMSEVVLIRFRNDDGTVVGLPVYREDRVWTDNAGERATYLILDFAVEERQNNQWDEPSRSWLRSWVPTGRIGVEIQHVDGETGEGVTEPTVKMLDQPRDSDTVLPAGGRPAEDGQVAWAGYTLEPTSPRWPAP